MHYLVRLVGILFPDADKNEIVENTLSRQRHIGDFWKIHFEHRQKDPDTSVSEIKIFHWRNSNDGSGVNRCLAVGDRGEMKHRVPINRRIKACMITKRPLLTNLTGLYISFQDEIDVGRYRQIHGLASDELDRFLAHKTSEKYLIQTVRQRCGGRECVCRVPPKTNRYRHSLVLLVITAAVPSADLVHLPVHCGCPAIKNLHPIHPNVSLTGVGICCVNHRQRDKASTVFRPTEENRKIIQRKAVALRETVNLFLARAI